MASIENTPSRTSAAEAAAMVEERLQGLTPEQRAQLRQAGQHLERGELERAEHSLRAILSANPDHAETLRLYAVASQLRGRTIEAAGAVRHALKQRPADPLLLNTLGTILRETGDVEGAVAAFRRACELNPNLASAWFNLGMALQSRAETAQAQAAFARASLIQPDYVMARVANGNALTALGRIEESIAEFRAAIAQDPRTARAWAALAEIKTIPLGVEDIAALERLHADKALGPEDHALVGFALARGLEDSQRYDDAFTVLSDANATMRRLWPWDAAAHSQVIASIVDAFATPPAPAPDATLGSEVIFIVSLPRAGSTLAEQILAAHPEVEGAGEINDLALILQDESRRRDEEFPNWITKASPADWERLGREYLERTQRWRTTRRVHVDKALFNWPFVGAAMAMLPGARIVNCRRDPMETCWSCFKQRFSRGQQVFSYSLEDLGAYWVDYDSLMHFWHARYPGRVYDFVYEDLIAAPEAEIRRLLDFCGLPFASSSLRFHQVDRAVRTASGAQVRQPLRGASMRTPNYGDHLAPLRRALGI
ncbi:MAG: sulfotransferase [Rhodanobacteraceae bacterium]